MFKDLVTYFRENPKQAVKDFLKILFIFAVWGAFIWFCCMLQGCSVVRDTTIDGKTTIITVDTTYIKHNGFLKYPKH